MKQVEIENRFTDVVVVNISDDDDDDDENDDDDKQYHNKSSSAPTYSQADIENDELYGHEVGYWIIKMIRGTSCGRQLKRNYFKLGLSQLTFGFALFVMTLQIDRTFPLSAYYNIPTYGLSIRLLMWTSSFPSIFMGSLSMLFVKYWASLCTNKELLATICKVYMTINFIIFCALLWCLIAFFLTFQRVNWYSSPEMQLMFPIYICVIIFNLPLLIANAIYVSDIWYLLNELESGLGEITDPDPPPDIMDLTDVTISQLLLVAVCLPIVICIQCGDFLSASRQYLYRWCVKRRIASENAAANRGVDVARHKGRRTLGSRIVRTIVNRFTSIGSFITSFVPSSFFSNTSTPDKDTNNESSSPEKLKLANRDREVEERLERERIDEERKRKAEQKLEIKKKQQQEEAEARRKAQESAEKEMELQARREEEEKLSAAREEAEKRRQEEEELLLRAPILTGNQFKKLWSSLPTGGSFQCKLKSMPSAEKLKSHLQKQGFHIVYTTTPTSSDIEIGICNVRQKWIDNENPGVNPESWFMARFLASSSHFSAVMKTSDNDPAFVKNFVKKFALAKILKMESG